MDQHTLHPPRGSKQVRKRLGRGNASGQGTTAGRGSKGQKSRGSIRPGFEGGQNPLVRRMPRLRGFRNFSRVEFQAVNLASLADRFEAGATVDAEALVAARLLDDVDRPFKVLGRGELSHALTVKAPRLSQSAKDAITSAGGSFEELAPALKRVRNRIHRRRAAAAAAIEAVAVEAAAAATTDATENKDN
ncbi:MAG: 50S ribosomal protein L15 [Dehalococcoidia bacterium]|nr:50S ribosomal protein L15 [Dehalococcoidia bacterium]